MSPRNRILGHVRAATATRPEAPHPGRFDGTYATDDDRTPVERFSDLFTTSGGEIERFEDVEAAARWLARYADDYDGVTVGATVPTALRPALPSTCPDLAPLGVTLAAAAIAETGSLVLDARDGRRTQLLAPTHVVFVKARDIHSTLVDALSDLRGDLPSAIGLHSGPSKSADIGQILVRGVHGPGRIVAAILGEHPDELRGGRHG
ncbi:MAG: LUD domain-containing protein [Gemmatimonadota bacterium]|nr:LUD domain-containing protein [Gemmatimonadota bacterium]